MKVKRFNVELPLEEAVLLAQYFKKCYQAAPKFQLQEDKKIKKIYHSFILQIEETETKFLQSLERKIIDTHGY